MYAELVRKRCANCKEEKGSDQYYRRTISPDGLGVYCKKCDNVKSSVYRVTFRDQVTAQRKAFRDANKNHVRMQKFKSKFGITEQEYVERLESQAGKCAICGDGPEKERYKRLSLDHCHATGTIRGFLCNNCNRALGLLKDDASHLEKGIRYLNKYKK